MFLFIECVDRNNRKRFSIFILALVHESPCPRVNESINVVILVINAVHITSYQLYTIISYIAHVRAYSSQIYTDVQRINDSWIKYIFDPVRKTSRRERVYQRSESTGSLCCSWRCVASLVLLWRGVNFGLYSITHPRQRRRLRSAIELCMRRPTAAAQFAACRVSPKAVR